MYFRNHSRHAVTLCLATAFAVAVLSCMEIVSAQTTQMYSFESPDDLDGFAVNGVLSTVTLNTDTNFVSEGVQSLKWEFLNFASFEGVQTANVDIGILNDPPGVDFIRFDFINTNRYVPDAPVPGTDPTFASISLNVFGEFASNPGVTENIQFFGSEEAVGNLEPGTHEIDVDVTGGGLLIGTGTVQGFNDYIADGLTVSGFQIYLNKTVGFTPAFAWTVYIDDIRAGRNSGAGNGGDYNGNGIVDAADYTVWRNNLGGIGPNGDGTTTGDLLGVPDGVVNEWDYDYWRQEFGNMVPGAGGEVRLVAAPVPEPSGALLLLIGGARWCRRKRSGKSR